ncbi:MAG: respiratory nitrate reductase subunit gamma [bacterium]|nr:respiratory nitrate reductase subunit gamma [bacterium]
MRSDLLQSAETIAHLALIVMAIVYTLRIRWLLKFKAGKERQAPTGTGGPENVKRSIIYSWANIALPQAMESTRTKPMMYVQFVIFHLGVVLAIGLTFIIPYLPAMLENPIFLRLFQVVIGGACLVGVYRIFRRFGNKYIRAISTPDDYFSLILLTAWFFFAFLSVPNDISGGEWHLLTFFFMTAFFLLYVPFSKISHYLYYPFTRYYLGKTLGRRGVFPMKRTA